MTANPSLNILVALQAEAQPFIEKLKLKRQAHRGVNLYCADQGDFQTRLLVTGVGRMAMAAGVGWLAAFRPQAPHAWLNLGTAGHFDLPTGTAVRVVNSHEVGSDRSHFPPLVVPWRGHIGALLTRDVGTADYPSNAIVDMEGSAFFNTAVRFAPAELVQAIKVVSDNAQTDLSTLSGKLLTEYMRSALTPVLAFIDELMLVAAKQEMAEDVAHVQALSIQLRASVNQRLQLEELYQKQINLGAQAQSLTEDLRQATSCKALLQKWRQRLNNEAPDLNILAPRLHRGLANFAEHTLSSKPESFRENDG